MNKNYKEYKIWRFAYDSYVDNILVHTRNNWGPTPIPHLPMKFHINLWPTKSRELAGNIDDSKLPTNLYLEDTL